MFLYFYVVAMITANSDLFDTGENQASDRLIAVISEVAGDDRRESG